MSRAIVWMCFGILLVSALGIMLAIMQGATR
jgi:hypothetical protein